MSAEIDLNTLVTWTDEEGTGCAGIVVGIISPDTDRAVAWIDPMTGSSAVHVPVADLQPMDQEEQP